MTVCDIASDFGPLFLSTYLLSTYLAPFELYTPAAAHRNIADIVISTPSIHHRKPSSPRNTSASLYGIALVVTMTLESQPAPVLVGSLSSKRPANDINSPLVRTPSRIATPPPPDRQWLQARTNLDGGNSKGSSHMARLNERGVDPEVLARALSREVSADRRDSAPAASPSGNGKRRRIDADRLVLSSLAEVRSLTSLGLYLLVLVKISKLVIPFSTKKVRRLLRRGRRERPTASFIFRKVSHVP